MNGRVGQFNEWPKRPADELIAIGRVQDAVIKRHLSWLRKRKKLFDCTAWEMCGCTTVQFVAHFERLFFPGMHWANFGIWNIDHVYPLSAVNLANDGEVLAAFHLSNLRPVWCKENLKKGRKVMSVLAPRSAIRRYTTRDVFAEIRLRSLPAAQSKANSA